MTTEASDPRSFKDWEEAFQHPIPTTRKFEQRLRGHADENRQKLRTIVGASYRDLLGTADRIITMDEQMRAVESSLAQSAQHCNSKAVERIFVNSLKLNTELQVKKKAKFTLASQLSLLQRCITAVSKLLKSGASPLLAAKLLVLSRILHKVLIQSEPDSDLLDSTRNRLHSLGRRLVRVINQKLGDADAEWKTLVDNMCAYALTSSATPTDILRHFHNVRLQAMEGFLVDDESNAADPTKAVKLLVQTAQVTQLIFPKRLSDALARLKDLPLLQQKDVLSLDELELSIHAPWVAEELRNYTPWPRHDELQKSEADKQLKAWTKQAVRSFVNSLKRSLSAKHSFDEVVQARKEIFNAWPWSGRGLPGLDPDEIVDELREILNEKLSTIISDSTGKLDGVLSIVHPAPTSATTKQWSSSLWDPDLVAADASNGGAVFKERIRNVYYGDDTTSFSAVQAYDTWLDEVTSLMSALKGMKEDRWEADLAEDDDDIDTESRRALLSEDDPRDLEEALSESLQKGFSAFQTKLTEQVQHIADTNIEVSVVYLRIIREISQRSVGEGFGRKLQVSHSFGRDLVGPLQEQIARKAVKGPFEKYLHSLESFGTSSTLTGRLLWEGNPPLPIQPSPAVYRFLRDMNSSMSQMGGDIWSSGTTKALKQFVHSQLSHAIQHDCLQTIIKQMAPAETNGHENSGNVTAETEESDQDREQSEYAILDQLKREKTTQLLFDWVYLSSAFGSEETASRTAKALIEAAKIEESDRTRMEKNATEYWKRTYLMFALLAE